MKRPLDEMEAFRAQELLLARATQGLDAAEAAELAALGVEDDLSFDLAAAALDLAAARVEPLPMHLAEKLAMSAPVRTVPTTLAGVVPAAPIHTTTGNFAAPIAPPETMPASVMPGATMPVPGPTTSGIGQAPAATDVGSGIAVQGGQRPPIVGAAAATARADEAANVIPLRKRSRSATVAWIAAAACFALAAGAVLWATQREPQVAAAPSAAEARTALLAARDAVRIDWTATADPAARGASGDVVWSASEQRGYMRFVGLAPNDRTRTQYQLWIFDRTRDEKFPVDGGVFDVTASGEVIVPIAAKLHVDEATLFAVTIEQPGGVVVSKREHIVVTAAPAKT